jgi:hypothetical protein
MKPLYVLLVGVVVGWAASGVDWSREAAGQESADAHSAEATTTSMVTEGTIPAPPQKGMADWLGTARNSADVKRYQISAYSDQGRDGAYVIDSVTGKIWRVRNGLKAELVNDELPEK